MEVDRAITTRLAVREFTDEAIDDSSLESILEAARLAPSGRNDQHWRFIVVEDDDLVALADASTTGGWVVDAAVAIIVLTDPSYAYHEIDAGRTITYMQFAAWDEGIGSCIFTGFDKNRVRDRFDVHDEYAISAVVGFGDPRFDVDDVRGQKDREPISALVYRDRFGSPLERFD